MVRNLTEAMVSSVELYLNHESLGQSFAIEIGEKTQSQKYKKYKNTQLQNTAKIRWKKVRVGNGCEVKVRETRGTGGERDP